MNLRRRLQQLENRLGPLGQGETSLDELEQIFCCSRRNIQLILAALVEAGWVTWLPGQGRGNRSHITLLHSFHQLTYEEAQEACQCGQLDQAMALLEEIGSTANFVALLSQMVQQRHCADGIIIPLSSHILELDPAQSNKSSDLHVIDHLYDGLLEVSLVDGSLLPSLAHHWEEREEGYCWYFWIRNGVRFHHGPLLEADDIVRSLNRLRHHSCQHHLLYSHINSVRALSPLKVEVRLNNPDPFLLQLLANPHSKIIASEGACDSLGRFAPFGTGPFKLHQRSEHHLILRRHDYYWGTLPQLEQIEIWNIPPSNQQPSLWLRANPKQGREYHSVNKSHETAGCFYLIFHHMSPLWRDEKRRCTLWHHLEQERYNATGLIVANSIFPGGYMLPSPCLKSRDWSQLRRPLRIFAPDTDRSKPQRQWLEQSLTKLGVKCDWQPLPGALNDASLLLNADLVLLGEVLDSQGEWGLLELLISSIGVTMAIGHKEHKKIVQNLRSHISRCRPEERLGLLLQQEAHLCSQYRYLPLFRQEEHVIFDPRLKGVIVNPQGYCSFKYLWLDEPQLGINICTP
ncbi:ABC transporter substrate-binding protein [Aeromonas aquatilis]